MKALFDHEKLDVYHTSLAFLAWAEEVLRDVPLAIAAKDHLRRASESIVRNIVSANSKRTPGHRSQFLEVSYGSALECAACADVLHAWGILETSAATNGKTLLDRVVAMLIGLHSTTRAQIRESRGTYSGRGQRDAGCLFAHEQLRVYQSTIELICWCAALVRQQAVGLAAGRELDRHCTSIALNIAEGNGKFSTADRTRFLDTALGAGLQAASSLDIMRVRSVITEEVVEQGKARLRRIVPMIGALARSLKHVSEGDLPRSTSEEGVDERT